MYYVYRIPMIPQQLAAGPAASISRAGQLRFGFVVVLVGQIVYGVSRLCHQGIWRARRK
jgi:hypothetical protein